MDLSLFSVGNILQDIVQLLSSLDVGRSDDSDVLNLLFDGGNVLSDGLDVGLQFLSLLGQRLNLGGDVLLLLGELLLLVCNLLGDFLFNRD